MALQSGAPGALLGTTTRNGHASMNRSLIRLAALAALLAMANTTRAANTALLDPLSWQEH
jgi:hypothetical protein